MAKTLSQIRATLRQLEALSAGEDREAYAERWLSAMNWRFEKIDQARGTMSERLRAFGGKRPDFILETDDEHIITVADAKHHTTDDELGKYRGLKVFIEKIEPECSAEVIFMVIPKEHQGTKLVFASLDEFDRGHPTTLVGKPATEIRLDNRPDLWFDIPPAERR